MVIFEISRCENSSSLSKDFNNKQDSQIRKFVKTPAPRPTVKFSNSIQYFSIPKVAESQGRDIWYSDNEFDDIERENRKVLRDFLNGRLVAGEDEKETYRGLEKLDDCYVDVSRWSIRAVLVEQKRQRIRGIQDPVAIADKYRACGTTTSQDAAAATGQSDYENSSQICKIETPTRQPNIKAVKFSNTIEYFAIVNVNDSLEKAIWYADSEYEDIEKENRRVLDDFFMGLLVEEKDTYRGLEKFEDHTMISVSRRSIRAVLVKQKRQKYRGINDPIKIADKYRACGAITCQHTAAAKGESDYKHSIR